MNTVNSGSYISYLANQAEGVHLGHVYEFAEMSKRIALEQIYEVVPALVEEIASKVIKQYLESNIGNGVNYDIHSIASVSIEQFNKIFRSEQFSRFMSDAITDEIRKRIQEIDFNIKIWRGRAPLLIHYTYKYIYIIPLHFFL